jgi:hypothetical protein
MSQPPPQPIQQAGRVPGQQEERQSLWKTFISILPRIIIGFMIFQLMGSSKKPAAPQPSSIPTSGDMSSTTNAPKAGVATPLYPKGTPIELRFYASTEAKLSPDVKPLLKENIELDESSFKVTLEIPCPPSVQQNGTLYGFVRLIFPNEQKQNGKETGEDMVLRTMLNRYIPKRKATIKKNLIDSQQDDSEVKVESAVRPIVSYWYPNITIHTVIAPEALNLKSVHPRLIDHVKVNTQSRYLPILVHNDFWLLHEDLQPLNDTVTSLTVDFDFSPIAMWKYLMYQQFSESFRVQSEVMGVDVEEIETIKRMFIDTNPILLAITMIVSLLHSIFDFLAFKNDIKFWKDRKNMEGLSFRAIVMNVVTQLIVFLYLVDNDTSYLVCVSSGVGLLIEVWKIHKTVIVKQKPQFPYFKFVDRVKPSKLASKTQEYDRMAFGYLTYLFIPLMCAYTVYSVMYEKHKSWYSFILGTLVGFVYTFGRVY